VASERERIYKKEIKYCASECERSNKQELYGAK